MITGALTQVAQRTEQGAHRIHVDDDGRFGAPGTEDWMAFFRDSEDNLAGLVERRPPA
jgi:methylmalonyl-CoA/ethylmalonyl-CoA epimerase